MMTETLLFNKLKGILFGQAIGDALGLGCEFLSKKEIAHYYPNGFSDYNQIIQDEHRKRWGIGAWTDDTDQFLCLYDSVIENQGEVVLGDVSLRLYNWFLSGGMGIGKLTNSVFKMPEYTKYPDKCAELAWKMTRKQAAPNGALMRNGVIAMMNYQNLGKALSLSEAICKLTHFDPRCIDSCKIHTTLLISLIKGEKLTLNEVMERSDVQDDRTVSHINIFLTHNLEDLNLDNSNEVGYTLKALSSALWVYFYAESFEEGLIKIINEGGDADTNGCVAGTVLGAKFGFDSIPKRWIKGLALESELEGRMKIFS